jgi:glutamate dehydrogenase (NAD(P)+)
MAWMMDTLSVIGDDSAMASVTGKPVALGGSLGRGRATGQGIAIVALALLRQYGRHPEETSVAVQGFGKVGAAAAGALDEAGCRIVAVSDVSTALYHPNGLDIAALEEHVRQAPDGLLASYAAPGIEHFDNSGLLALDVDVLIPAAMEAQITAANAHRVRAWAIVEGANGPVTAEADRILEEKGIIVVPDILANAGGVVVSHLEWVQDRQGFFWDADEGRGPLAPADGAVLWRCLGTRGGPRPPLTAGSLPSRRLPRRGGDPPARPGRTRVRRA